MLSLIAAFSKATRVIGSNGKIPWAIKEDLSHFKRVTMGGALIMGRRTFESIGSPLAGRFIAVVSSRYKKSAVSEGVAGFSSIQNAIEGLKKRGYEKIFFCGGERIYREGLKLCDKLFLTIVKKSYDGDAFFPKFSEKDYKVIKREEKAECTFLELERIGAKG